MLFSLWSSLRIAIENPSPQIQVIEWFFLVVSGICFLAVIAKLFPFLYRTIMQRVPRLNKILTNQNASWFFVPLVLLSTFIGFPTNIILNWSKLQGISLYILVVVLVCWIVAYLWVFVAMVSQIGKKGRIIGGIASVIIIGNAINAFQSDVLAGCMLLVIGVASIILVIKPPKGIWHFQEVV